MANGLLTIWSADANRRGESRWVVLLLSGVLSIAIGVMTFVTPGVAAIVLLYFIAHVGDRHRDRRDRDGGPAPKGDPRRA